MNRLHYEWSLGNSKLKKERIASFNIPALLAQTGFTVCPNAGICAGLCYARQGRFTMAMVQAPRERNLARLLDTAQNNRWGWIGVLSDLIDDVNRLPKRIRRVRIHDSGDFFEPIYMRTWLDVATQCPQIEFYAYTKMITDLQWYQANGFVPGNMRLVQSVGGKQDDLIDRALPHSRIFPTEGSLRTAGYVDATHTDKPAYSGVVNIGLVYHGTRKLTNAQTQQLLSIEV